MMWFPCSSQTPAKETSDVNTATTYGNPSLLGLSEESKVQAVRPKTGLSSAEGPGHMDAGCQLLPDANEDSPSTLGGGRPSWISATTSEESVNETGDQAQGGSRGPRSPPSPQSRLCRKKQVISPGARQTGWRTPSKVTPGHLGRHKPRLAWLSLR